MSRRSDRHRCASLCLGAAYSPGQLSESLSSREAQVEGKAVGISGIIANSALLRADEEQPAEGAAGGEAATATGVAGPSAADGGAEPMDEDALLQQVAPLLSPLLSVHHSPQAPHNCTSRLWSIKAWRS